MNYDLSAYQVGRCNLWVKPMGLEPQLLDAAEISDLGAVFDFAYVFS